MTNPLLAFFLQLRIVHEGSRGIRRRLLFLLTHEVGGDVRRIFRRQAQAGHHGHVLHLQFVTVVGTLAVLQIKLVGQAFLGVVLGTDIFLFVRTIRPRALPRVVNPADQVFVIRLLTLASQIRGKRSALKLVTFTDGVASQAAASFEQLFAVLGVAGFLLGQSVGESRLPQIRRDRLDLMIGQAEIRHLGCRTEIGRLLQPHRNPVRIQLEPDIFQIWPDFLHVLHQVVGLKIKLLNAAVNFAVGHS